MTVFFLTFSPKYSFAKGESTVWHIEGGGLEGVRVGGGQLYFSALFIGVTESQIKSRQDEKKENFKRKSVGSHHWEVWLDLGALPLILGLIPAQPFILHRLLQTWATPGGESQYSLITVVGGSHGSPTDGPVGWGWPC